LSATRDARPNATGWRQGREAIDGAVRRVEEVVHESAGEVHPLGDRVANAGKVSVERDLERI